MKKCLLMLIFLLSSLTLIYGYDKIQVPFKVGEYLEYEVRLFNQTVGIQKVWVKDMVMINNKSCYHIMADVETTPFVSRIYHLHDVFHEYLDPDTLLPVRIEGKKKEGTWTNTIKTEIDQKEKVIHYWDSRKGRTLDIPFQGDVVGLVSILFYARTYTPKSNEHFKVGLSIDNKIENIEVVCNGTKTSLPMKTLKKDYTTFYYQQIGGRKVSLWIVNDNNRLPLRLISVELKLAGRPVTSVEAWLRKFKL